MTKKFLFLLALLLPQHLYSDSGKSTLHFLLENLNARQMGGGGIYAATAKNADALNTNPAGLLYTPLPELNFSYVGTHSDGSYTSTNFSTPYWQGKLISFGVGAGFTYYTAGNIDINYANGSSDSFDAEKSFVAQTGVALEVGKWFSIGAAPKYVSSLLVEQYLARGWALDAGILIIPFPNLLREKLILGASVLNLGAPVRYRTQTQDLPRTEAVGAALTLWNRERFDSFLIQGQMEKTLHEKYRYRLGAEYGLGGDKEKTFILRGGYLLHFDDKDYTLGLGIREKMLRLDYAYVNGTELGITHRFTLSLRFGKTEEEIEKEVKHELLDAEKGLKPEDEVNDKIIQEMNKSLNKKVDPTLEKEEAIQKSSF